MPRDFKLYHDENTPDEIIDLVVQRIMNNFSMKVRIVGIRIPSKKAWIDEYQAFDCRELMRLIEAEGISFFLWIVDSALFCDGQQAFGYGEKMRGAILSTKSLYNKNMMVSIEATTLAGTVFGLSTCTNNCLMSASDTLEQILQKPAKLCSTCSAKFQKLKLRL